MFRNLISGPWILGGLVFFVLVVGSSLLYSWHVERGIREEEARTVQILQQIEARKVSNYRPQQNEPTATETLGQDIMEDEIDVPVPIDDPERIVDDVELLYTEPELSKPRGAVQTSLNPFFANGVPEHLQCPEELVGRYAGDLSTDEKFKIYQIYQEVVEKYNPNRPLSEVWPQFIEAETYYHANAEPDNAIPGIAAGRSDWGVQTILDYPEIVLLEVEDAERFSDICMVATGRWDPDWNLHILPDGREFRTDTGYYYEFFFSHGEGLGVTTIRIGHSGRNAQLVKVDLDKTLDEELERLSGWDYNINPYTTGIYQSEKK